MHLLLKVITKLIDETNEYKFTMNDVIKKKDEHFLLFEKIILNNLMIDSSLIVWIILMYLNKKVKELINCY